jgi:ribosomal protein S18 acetylase RimI-like enzyme
LSHAAAVSLRAATSDDGEFLHELYASTRADELAPLGWDETALEQFLRMQFDTQSRAYKQTYPDASHQIVLVGGRPAGRLYVHRGKHEIHVVDIALLPEHRGQGLGTALLQGLIDEAQRDGRRVVLEVVRENRALRLYERLGFELVQAGEVHLRLTAGGIAPS